MSISGLVVEYIAAIDVTRVRFPADALSHATAKYGQHTWRREACMQMRQGKDVVVVGCTKYVWCRVVRQRRMSY